MAPSLPSGRRLRLQAVYTGDANNNGATSTCGTEPFTVTQTSPTLATALSAGTAAIGIPVHDTASLTRDHRQRRGYGDLHRLHRQRLYHPGVDQPGQRPAAGGNGDQRGGA